MANNIRYVCCCNTGRIRKNNQDNFFVDWKYLYSENFALETPLTGIHSVAERPAYAVFDGMGGEKHGEIASFISANTFSKALKTLSGEPAAVLNSACYMMNDAVCHFMLENSIRSMGSTAAILMFDPQYVTVCNLGDSGVFRVNESNLLKVSTDHVESNSAFSSKPMLTQFVGIPKEEYLIEPSIKILNYASGDRFLICSDGLTDMVKEPEIAAIINSCPNIEVAADMLLAEVLRRGGVDNTTIIICEVC
jgi:protein phosphatase